MITSRSDIGGGPKHLYDLIQSFDQSIEVYVASPEDAPFGQKFKNEARGFFSIPSRSFSLSKFIQLIKWAKSKDIEIVHSHGRGAGIYSRLMRIFGFKVVHTFHGVHFGNSTKEKMSLLIEKTLSPLGDHYIFCSSDEKEEAFKFGLKPINISVIYNGVDSKAFKFHQKRIELKTVGTIARFDLVKGFDYLFRNIEFINSKMIGLKFLIAGANIQDFENMNSMPSNIEFLGELTDPNEFYSRIDLLVSHSRKEGLPLNVLEAMASNVPCLLSEVPGHHYFIKNNIAAGFILDNQDSFLNSLLELLNFEEREKVTSLAYKFILENHSLDQVARKVVAVYNQI
jgi:glycosyltransferase involved in cell wall biosynthesis